MREILFKAKRIDNGEWVEGFYQFSDWIYPTTGELAERKYYIRPIRSQDAFEVNPDTICQYTGLNDKNGNKVFIGDIVRCSCGCPHEVIWLEEYGGTYVGGMPAIYLSGLLNGYAWTNSEEIIGNVFDNADLVKG